MEYDTRMRNSRWWSGRGAVWPISGYRSSPRVNAIMGRISLRYRSSFSHDANLIDGRSWKRYLREIGDITKVMFWRQIHGRYPWEVIKSRWRGRRQRLYWTVSAIAMALALRPKSSIGKDRRCLSGSYCETGELSIILQERCHLRVDENPVRGGRRL